MLVDPSGTCATVQNHDPNGDNDQEAAGEFGPYAPEDELAAGGELGSGIQQCLVYGSTNPWDELEIDGALVDDGMGLGYDLEYGGSSGTGSAVGAIQTYSMGSGLETTAYQSDINPAPAPEPSPAACLAKIIGAVDSQFGTLSSQWTVQASGIDSGGGEFNVRMTSAVLTVSQFNAIDTGRYASVLTVVTGVGDSLHIAGPSPLDPRAVFQKTNIGGAASVTITAHLDSGYAYNPFGALAHLLIDVLGHATRNPCP